MKTTEPRTRICDVIVFETHPAVRAGLVRRLEAEPGVVVVQAFSDVVSFARAVERLTPAFAVVGLFGPHGSRAANRAVDRSTGTNVIAVAPYMWSDGVSDLDHAVTVVEDGPRGHRLADVVMGRKSLQKEASCDR